MASAVAIPKGVLTVADLVEKFGPLPAERLRWNPAPGTATERDVVAIHDRENRLCELVDGVLVEKTVGFSESVLAALLAYYLTRFVKPRKLGLVAAADGMIRLAPSLVRIPDVSFISWNRLPGRRMPREPIPNIAPELAIEVLSKGNTAREMERKLRDFFAAGILLVWFVDPRKRTVSIYTSVQECTVLREQETLKGGKILPGFALPLRKLFAELDAQEKPVRRSSIKGNKRNGRQ
jgi:Uma2 family endonuclease